MLYAQPGVLHDHPRRVVLVDDLVTIPLRHFERLHHSVVESVEQIPHLLDGPTCDQVDDDKGHRSDPDPKDRAVGLEQDRLCGAAKHQLADRRALLEPHDDQAGPHLIDSAQNRVGRVAGLLLV